MAIPSAYLSTVKNTVAILDAIKRAAVPPRFTFEFLKQLGYPSSGDRPHIAVLKAIGFLDQSSVPTDLYRRFKDVSESAAALAEGLRLGYSDLFAIDTAAHTRTNAQLVGLFARLSDKGEAVNRKMAATFKTLAGLADFDAARVIPTADPDPLPESAEQLPHTADVARPAANGGQSISLRHDIHVHLPASTDVAVYDAIFKSLRANIL